MIRCGFCSLMRAQKTYVCELESFSPIYGLKQFDYYLKGMCHFKGVVDHNPIKGIFARDMRDVYTIRLFNIQIEFANYKFTGDDDDEARQR